MYTSCTYPKSKQHGISAQPASGLTLGSNSFLNCSLPTTSHPHESLFSSFSPITHERGSSASLVAANPYNRETLSLPHPRAHLFRPAVDAIYEITTACKINNRLVAQISVEPRSAQFYPCFRHLDTPNSTAQATRLALLSPSFSHGMIAIACMISN